MERNGGKQAKAGTRARTAISQARYASSKCRLLEIRVLEVLARFPFSFLLVPVASAPALLLLSTYVRTLLVLQKKPMLLSKRKPLRKGTPKTPVSPSGQSAQAERPPIEHQYATHERNRSVVSDSEALYFGRRIFFFSSAGGRPSVDLD
jgi:hypothetical protein